MRVAFSVPCDLMDDVKTTRGRGGCMKKKDKNRNGTRQALTRNGSAICTRTSLRPWKRKEKEGKL